ncbi:MAG: hypothetical protein JXQ72_09670, partial [Anaerolineae bacterium]|nr:hypothetical protein [Anaerolineae bacterium]
DMLESTYTSVLDDLAVTRATAQELNTLMANYRRTLKQYGLWDAAPSVWEAQVSGLAGHHAQIEADITQIDITLRRVELMMRAAQTRTGLLYNERQRLLTVLVALLGLALLVVLLVDTNPVLMVARLVALLLVAGSVWFGMRRWLGSGPPGTQPPTN